MARDSRPAASGPPTALQKGLWFVGLWIASVMVLGIVAYGIRLVLI